MLKPRFKPNLYAAQNQQQWWRCISNWDYRLLLVTALLTSGSWLPVLPVLAASPTAGTVIDNQATGSFIDTVDNTEKQVESNVVSVTVAEVAGIAVTATSVPTEAPSSVSGAGRYQEDGTINTGDIVYFQFTITNVGNDPTQFFLPSAPFSITGGTQQGLMQIIEVDPDGSGSTAPIALPGGNPVDISASGERTGPDGAGNNGLLGANGSIPVGGTVKIRVPIKVTAPNTGDTVTVVMGDTPVPPNANNQNQPYTAGNKDVYTLDNPNGTAGEASGTPINGDATNHRQEASASQITTLVAPPGVNISGTVFEDVNYGGRAGRPLYTPGTSPRSGATVELYKSDGTYVTNTNTNGSGQYTLTGVTPGNYLVRVVNTTVTSSRSGYVTSLLPVQTFRTNGDANNDNVADADPDRVGGEKPDEADAPANSGTQSLATLNSVAGQEVQSLASIAVGSSNITGVDFGFNFDTIVNKNDSAQGSLRQFILNSNALGGEASLSQSGSRKDGSTTQSLPSGKETSIFMIPSSQLTNGVAVITPTTTLPQITGANAPNTVIDGTTQTANVGDTNSGTLGIGGTVGVENLSLSTVNRPEVQIVDGGTTGLAIGLDVQANTTTIRGISIYGFGNAANSDNDANIRIGNNFTDTLIEQNIIGTTAISFTDPNTARSGGDNIRSAGADQGIVRNNLIGFSAGKGLGIENTSTNWLVENNEIRSNAIGNPSFNGIDLENGSNSNTVQRNLFVDNQGVGVDGYNSGGSNTIQNNTITGNGRGSTTGIGATAGVRIYGSNSTIFHNIIYNNYGAGVMVENGTTGNKISQNSIYNNGNVNSLANGAVSGQIGIDLLNSTNSATAGTSPYFTLNDLNDTDSGGNGLLNFPVLESATISGGNLIMTGFARPNSVIELFIADPDSSGFGEGKTYLVTHTESSSSDTDANTGTYSGLVNGIDQGTDNTNRFLFTIPLPGGVSVGTKLTATATNASNTTSEFSGIVTVANNPPLLRLVKRITKTFDRSGNVTSVINTIVNPNTTSDPNDNASNWPPNYLQGAIDGGLVKPGEIVEYTIYFLSDGGNDATNVKICDLVPPNTTFIPTAFNGSAPTDSGSLPGTDLGMALALGSTNPTAYLTNVADTPDRGQFFSGGTQAPAACNSSSFNSPLPAASNVSGAVVVNLGNIPRATGAGTPTSSYGFVRFQVRVK